MGDFALEFGIKTRTSFLSGIFGARRLAFARKQQDILFPAIRDWAVKYWVSHCNWKPALEYFLCWFAISTTFCRRCRSRSSRCRIAPPLACLSSIAPTGNLQDSWFRSLPDVLRAGDLLVLNDTRVLPARLFARRAGIHAQAISARNPTAQGAFAGKCRSAADGAACTAGVERSGASGPKASRRGKASLFCAGRC